MNLIRVEQSITLRCQFASWNVERHPSYEKRTLIKPSTRGALEAYPLKSTKYSSPLTLLPFLDTALKAKKFDKLDFNSFWNTHWKFCRHPNKNEEHISSGKNRRTFSLSLNRSDSPSLNLLQNPWSLQHIFVFEWALWCCRHSNIPINKTPVT